MRCKLCPNLIDRKEATRNEGICDTCAELQADERKISSDLLTSFSSKGSRGFVQWLKKGNFLYPIRIGPAPDYKINPGDVYHYNDRLVMVKAMIGPAKFGRLLNEFAKVILVIAKEETESND